MCFSPAASFAASSVLTLAGAAALQKAPKRTLPFASIPLLFAIQQFIEGLIWLQLMEGTAELFWLPHIYAFFAGMVWPVLVPASIAVLEGPTPRRRYIYAILGLGIVFSAYAFYVIFFSRITATLANRCILYQTPAFVAEQLFIAIYVIATCGAFFFSRHRCLFYLGVVNLAAFATAYHFYMLNFSSVWCYFAAIVSGLIYFCVTRLKEE